MAHSMTLQGTKRSLGETAVGECKCVYNPRTKRSAQLCFVGKSAKTRSGWIFQKGGNQLCKR